MEMDTEQIPDQKLDILVRSTGVFMQFGLRSVTMDDVARELKISKKTIYKYFTDKEDLLSQALELYFTQDRMRCNKITLDAGNAIDEMILIIKTVSETLRQIHPSIHYDMEKYYPRVWALFQEHKDMQIYHAIRQNMERGISEGLYRNNMKPEIIARMYSLVADKVFDERVFPLLQYQFGEVYFEYVRYHIRGIASEKGLKYLTSLVEKGEISL